ncbi:MAG TPA: hypothetical protein VF517_04370 [Thermoleophilaceae bacterium]
MAAEERFWTRRLRWRLIGAWRWPAFAAAILLDAVILHELPPLGSLETEPGNLNWPVSFIVSGFGNLALIALSDALGRFAESKRRAQGIHDPHIEVQSDRLAVGALAVGVVGVLAFGLATQGTAVTETEATQKNAQAVRDYVLTHGSEEYKRNLQTANTERLAEGYFRTCVADNSRRRFLCVFVDTKKDPPEVVRDPSMLPNQNRTP